MKNIYFAKLIQANQLNKNNDIFAEECLKKASEDWNKRVKTRLSSGEAWMICEDCGARLYSFDGCKDTSRKCPYMKNGKCEPK